VRWAVIDANERVSKQWGGITASVVGGWLLWELEQAKVPVAPPSEADIVLLVHSGVLDYGIHTRRELRRYSIDARTASRKQSPYIITGGPVDASPLLALDVADAVTIGEAYRIIRQAFKCKTLAQLRQLFTDDPHAIEVGQVEGLARDAAMPWLLAEARPGQHIAEPDPWIDWSAPDVKSDDSVVRIIGSKGCHLKCTFCATTYRQEYRSGPPSRLIQRANAYANERVQVLSNDPLNLNGFTGIQNKLDHASLTVMELADRTNLDAVIARRPSIIRVGVEGLSEDVRKAFGKPIETERLVQLLAYVHSHKVNTHSFWIHHAPYESHDSREGFWDTMEMLADNIDWGLHRAKMTVFQPNHPAPLARYLPPLIDDSFNRDDIISRRTLSPNLRRVLIVHGGLSKNHRVRCAENYQIPLDALPISDETTNMAPTFDDYLRFPSEMIRWPIRSEVRYKAGEVYRRRMVKEPAHA